MARNKKKAVVRNPLASIANELQKSGGGVHKDKRNKRKGRNFWKKEYLSDV